MRISGQTAQRGIIGVLIALTAGLVVAGVDIVAPAASSVVGVDDGLVPDGGRLSPHDIESPAIANLDPALPRAVQQAADDAAGDGIDMFLTTGWRSEAYQRQLFGEAVVRYGSEREALRYVSTPERSHHVTGDAVDIGPTDADSWLSQHGTGYGLCQTYANEMWHFELATTPGGVCPEMLPDASAAAH
ncbi:D-alanyl-D-alanine carboxypeptidase [Acrocarpospora corrugata]|uniref:D-alanyl-D-alanine carboxypeptidase n=1 Tax=Acrocarpospora corrugata TaxID=35763 RepID=A0A5M3VYW2_9ACTN|nr:M15 family metallopeptidase [Acrocarpospora corrugata]GES01624.1 D-alanyl-D-alanine carboxypeptidase [Acrocarpospora corrugata]